MDKREYFETPVRRLHRMDFEGDPLSLPDHYKVSPMGNIGTVVCDAIVLPI